MDFRFYDFASSLWAQHAFFPDADEHDFFSPEAEAVSVFAFFCLGFDSCAFTFIENKNVATAKMDTTFLIVLFLIDYY